MAKQKDTETVDTLEQQVVAYAEQLGRVVGTVQAKAEGWLDTEKLNEQISNVRDGATALLERLGAKTVSKTERVIGGRRVSHTIVTGRSGGVVDAPGKKHRIPPPKAPVRPTAPDLSRVPKKATNSRRRGGR
jgi:hypothetical protein